MYAWLEPAPDEATACGVDRRPSENRERERERLAGLYLYLEEKLDSVEGRGGRPRGGTGYPSSDEHLRRVGGSAHPPSTRSAASQWLPSSHRPLPSPRSLALYSLPVPESVRLRSLEKSGKVVSRARDHSSFQEQRV